MKQSIFLMIVLFHMPLGAVDFINVMDAPIYFSVFYKTDNSIKRQVKEIYTAQPNGKYFLSTNTFDLKNPALKIITFPWPKQKCVEFSDEELIALGVGVGVGAAALGAVAGAALAAEAGASTVTAGSAAFLGSSSPITMTVPAAGSTIAGGGLLGAGIVGTGGGLGAVGDALTGGDVCKAEHYPRTVLFSFSRADIEQLKYDRKSFPSMQRNTGLYFGDNVDGGETHFLFYNPYGFDPRYAAYGQAEPHGAIRAGKINSQSYDGKPPIADALRQYLRFVAYYVVS